MTLNVTLAVWKLSECVCSP